MAIGQHDLPVVLRLSDQEGETIHQVVQRLALVPRRVPNPAPAPGRRYVDFRPVAPTGCAAIAVHNVDSSVGRLGSKEAPVGQEAGTVETCNQNVPRPDRQLIHHAGEEHGAEDHQCRFSAHHRLPLKTASLCCAQQGCAGLDELTQGRHGCDLRLQLGHLLQDFPVTGGKNQLAPSIRGDGSAAGDILVGDNLIAGFQPPLLGQADERIDVLQLTEREFSGTLWHGIPSRSCVVWEHPCPLWMGTVRKPSVLRGRFWIVSGRLARYRDQRPTLSTTHGLSPSARSSPESPGVSYPPLGREIPQFTAGPRWPISLERAPPAEGTPEKSVLGTKAGAPTTTSGPPCRFRPLPFPFPVVLRRGRTGPRSAHAFGLAASRRRPGREPPWSKAPYSPPALSMIAKGPNAGLPSPPQKPLATSMRFQCQPSGMYCRYDLRPFSPVWESPTRPSGANSMLTPGNQQAQAHRQEADLPRLRTVARYVRRASSPRD
ncbi:hypothetical protein LG3211_4822 [Lysobacter gummosus]|nr:hypothetical protein LG3211_4822 [Lysobacter gummosus]